MGKVNLWTDAELTLVYRYFATATRDELCKMLPKRSYASIKTMATHLKIKRPRSEYQKFGVNTRKIDTGVLSIKGNITVHRMV